MLLELLLVLFPCQDAAPAAAKPVPTQMLRLRTGAVDFGAIVSHTPEGVRFKRLESGGEVDLPWGFLDPAEADGLRSRFGYVEVETEELELDADRIELADGREVVGRIVNRSATHLSLKRAEGTVPIPLTNVKGAITSTRAPALEIFTKEELYQEKTFELQTRLALPGRDGARAHDELAKYCERLYDYVHAAQHYRRTLELDPAFDPARLTAAKARCETKAALQGEVDELAAIDLWRARKRYDLAIEGIKNFRTLHPKSALLEDLVALQARVAKAQERDLREAIVSRWHHWSLRLAQEAGRKTSFEEVQAYLDEKMGEEVAQKVRDDVQTIAPGIEVDQVRKLWGERKGGKYHTATYGLGTWLIGESARAELDQEKKKAQEAPPAPGSAAEARKKLEERISRYLANQKLTKGSGNGARDEEEPQAFWGEWNWSGRTQWVLAYYSEKSGDFRDIEGRLSPCRECGGTGAREVLFTGSAASTEQSGARGDLQPCPTCHTIGVVRRVRYR
jgi:hypothetical protein